VRELLSYADKTAGRLMTDKFVRLAGTMSVEDAFTAIRRSDPEVETVADLYVTDGGRKGHEKLIGVLSLRDLVRAQPNARVAQVMVREPMAVSVDTDQEEVAQTISKYDFSAIPVLDRDGYLAGIVTVDDVVDVLVEEQTEDVLKQGAVSSEAMNVPYFSVPIWRVVRSRLPWLAMLFVASLLTTEVLDKNQAELSRVPVLSLFFTLLVGTGGNAGAQTISTVIRGMSLGEIRGARRPAGTLAGVQHRLHAGHLARGCSVRPRLSDGEACGFRDRRRPDCLGYLRLVERHRLHDPARCATLEDRSRPRFVTADHYAR
jgi:magnesium transporter